MTNKTVSVFKLKTHPQYSPSVSGSVEISDFIHLYPEKITKIHTKGRIFIFIIVGAARR